MCGTELKDDMRRLNCNREEESGLRMDMRMDMSCEEKRKEGGCDPGPDTEPPGCDPGPDAEPPQDGNPFSPVSGHAPSDPAVTYSGGSSPAHSRSISISVVPCSVSAEETPDPFSQDPRTPPLGHTSKTHPTKASHTPPLASRKLLQLLPNIGLTRSKSHESQLANRIEEPTNQRPCQKNRVLAVLQINGSGSAPDDSALRSPLLSARTPGRGTGPVPMSAPYMLPIPPTPLDNVSMHRSSPQTMRRDIGLAVTHRFSTKSWLSQSCQVCGKNMMFGVKCKHCRLKCHNKCTKDAPSCRISILTLPRMRRAESVPSDINNRIERSAERPPQFGTLPKTLLKREPPPLLDSSTPSSAASSTPSSPVHFHHTPPPSHAPPQEGSKDGRFHFPDVPVPTVSQQSCSFYESGLSQVVVPQSQQTTSAQPTEDAEDNWTKEEEPANGKGGEGEGEGGGDGLEDLPPPHPISRRGAVGRWRGGPSQASIYLQEWDIPYEQLQLGELIGKGRWGRVHRGRWHGEVAIRLLEVDGTNQEHLKLFKKEVMNYRQTRHQNVILFMGACMAPPHLAIITSFCKGVPLYSVVRERLDRLDINKTRQIAQDIVKGMGYLHAKGIIHKDLKSKNVFYDWNRVVITDFGLFGMAGVVQEDRRQSVVRIPRGWIYYLSSEIVRQMNPEEDQDRLPFSKPADVYAFGTIWYELHVGGWPLLDQPVEAQIWMVGSGLGMRRELVDANLGKEVTEILSSCWSLEPSERPSFPQLSGMLDRLPKLNRRLSHPGHFWNSPQ
ncbi:kinase suppressor of Ras 1-like [Sphaeramia orbicularis]|uniref:kinase suppressor of Ras 1-like n=1 Tax=Sphaeramia orbicularis TaxID=375764 RepID=UPI00117E2CF8|nr:kinase suppressor of Ras 1-like [Sphaeramia orbicularis]